MIKLLIIFTLLLVARQVSAQSTIEAVLSSVSKNNKTIIAQAQFWEAKKLSYKTGLTPENPSIAYEYLAGSPAGAGNQQDFFVLQSFDFPSAYFKKKQVTTHQVEQDIHYYTAQRQDVLLDAKKCCIELIHLRYRARVLGERQQTIKDLLKQMEKTVSSGETSVLELNKVKLQVLLIDNQAAIVKQQIQEHEEKLVSFNGGAAIVLQDTVYPLLPSVPVFETMEQNIEQNDPVIQAIEVQHTIDQKKLELSKALALPKFEGGFHHQAILGQQYQGVHIGMTIPLWESRNTVKHQKAHLVYHDLEMEEHKVHHKSEILQLYHKYERLKVILEEYNDLVGSLNTTALLDKALASGELSTKEYFSETSYYYEALDSYLDMQKEYQLTVAALFKYTL